MKCAQEAGRQTCRFSGIWCSNIVVDPALFDARRSMVLLLLLQWYTVWLDTIQILGRSLGEQKGNILPSELLWMAHCHLKQTRRKCTTAVLQNFFSQGRTGPSLAGTGAKYGVSLVIHFFLVADHRFHVCCLAEYGLEWPWTKQTLRGLGLVWVKHPHVPTTISLSPVFFVFAYALESCHQFVMD